MTSTTRNMIIAGAVLFLVLRPGRSSAAAIIQKFEGFRTKPYWDVNGWAVGYGSHWNYDKNREVIQSDVIDAQTALKWLNKRIDENKAILNRSVLVPINRNQVDSLLSLMYNIGSGAFSRSVLLSKLNAGKPKSEVAREFDSFVSSGGVRNPDLVKRRALEKQLFLS